MEQVKGTLDVNDGVLFLWKILVRKVLYTTRSGQEFLPWCLLKFCLLEYLSLLWVRLFQDVVLGEGQNASCQFCGTDTLGPLEQLKSATLPEFLADINAF